MNLIEVISCLSVGTYGLQVNLLMRSKSTNSSGTTKNNIGKEFEYEKMILFNQVTLCYFYSSSFLCYHIDEKCGG